jgi:hypothetical protein
MQCCCCITWYFRNHYLVTRSHGSSSFFNKVPRVFNGLGRGGPEWPLKVSVTKLVQDPPALGCHLRAQKGEFGDVMRLFLERGLQVSHDD